MSRGGSVVVEPDNLVADLVVGRYNKAVSEVRESVTDFNILHLHLKVVLDDQIM
jgi:hypothetical protein